MHHTCNIIIIRWHAKKMKLFECITMGIVLSLWYYWEYFCSKSHLDWQIWLVILCYITHIIYVILLQHVQYFRYHCDMLSKGLLYSRRDTPSVLCFGVMLNNRLRLWFSITPTQCGRFVSSGIYWICRLQTACHLRIIKLEMYWLHGRAKNP